MRKYFLSFNWIFVLLIASTPSVFAQTQGSPAWQKISSGVLEAHLGSLSISSVTPQILFLDSRENLYRTLDEGRHWTQVFTLPENTAGAQIHQAYTSPHHSDTVYVTSSEGLFVSRDLGSHFELLFSSAQKKERDCFSLAFHPLDPDILFLGTGNGLFWTLDGGETWNQNAGQIINGDIIKIILNPTDDRSFLLLTPYSLYSLEEKSGALTTLFVLPAGSERRDPDEKLDEEPFERVNKINDAVILPNQGNKILLATQSGVLENSASAKSWTSFPMRGLKSQEITKIIAPDASRIFTATSEGVYRFIFQENRWEELKNGLVQTDSNNLAFHPLAGGILYTVTSAGAYRLPLASGFEIEATPIRNIHLDPEHLNLLNDYFKEEPDLQSIHREAIRYADLNPTKIARWQSESRLSHLMPKLSAGMSKSIDQNIDIDRGGTNNPDYFIIGPNDKSWDQNVSISWDFAELIWSSDQTSIDSRSKLMTELRNEILSNLTRLYFERKRLITEYYLKPPQDELEQIDLVQHIEEITAHIDAYTGGYFSKELERRKIDFKTADHRL